MKEANLKILYIAWFQVYDILEMANLQRQYKDQWLPEGAGFLGQWKYSIWYHNGGYMLSCIFPNPYNVQAQEWILK